MDLAYTTDEENDAVISVYADLVQYRITTEYGGNIAREEQYNSLDEMNELALKFLSFDDLISLSDEEKGLEVRHGAAVESNESEVRHRGAPIKLSGRIEKYDLDIDFANLDYIEIEERSEVYLGGIDDNGHERKDNFRETVNHITFFASPENDAVLFNDDSQEDYFDNPIDVSEALERICKYIDMSAESADVSVYIKPIDGERQYFDPAEVRHGAAVESELRGVHAALGLRQQQHPVAAPDETAAPEIETTDRAHITQKPPPPENYRFPENFAYPTGPKAKYTANVTAIKTLKQIESEHRHATAEEQDILAHYSGWGGIADAFDSTKENWSREYAELKALLTDKEYSAARESTLTAFYTEPYIIKSIYAALENMGFTGGEILDPAMGTGNFFGNLPVKMAENSRLYGVELDSLTARIAKELYPEAKIQNRGFERTKFENGTFDVIIGNVPFGDFKPYDPEYDEYLIHDYFFAKSIDKLKHGGIMALITSAGTMDKYDDSFRRELSGKADFLGGVRLPEDAFRTAGTQTVTDILFFQKLEFEHENDRNLDWVRSERVYGEASVFQENRYFRQNTEMVLGTPEIVSGRFGNTRTIKSNGNTAERLSETIGRLDGHFSAEPTIDDELPKEEYGDIPDGKQRFTKADIFTERTINVDRVPAHVDTALEALHLSINLKQTVDLEYISQLCGKDKDAVISELGEHIYCNPAKNTGGRYSGWETAEEYLSGHVRSKLALAQEAAKTDPDYERNVAALLDNQPPRIGIEDIGFRVGTIYIEPEMFQDFVYETFQTPEWQRHRPNMHGYSKEITVNYSPEMNQWKVTNSSGMSDVLSTETYGTKRQNGKGVQRKGNHSCA